MEWSRDSQIFKGSYQINQVIGADFNLVKLFPGSEVVVLARPELGLLQLERVELDLGSVRLRLGRELAEIGEDGFLDSADTATLGSREVGLLVSAVVALEPDTSIDKDRPVYMFMLGSVTVFGKNLATLTKFWKSLWRFLKP